MRADAAMIGGTGVGARLAAFGGRPLHVPTSFGIARGRMIEAGGRTIVVFQRHGPGHKVPPHRINYRALADAARRLGVRACFSTAATGGLRDDWTCGTLALCHDFVDATGRNLTLYDRSVEHTDFSEPFRHSARQAVLDAAEQLGVSIHPRAIYINGNGPRYETPFEIQLYRKLGGDVVGMTAATEAIAMGEAGVPYACLAVVTNLACGLAGQKLSHEEVVKEMERSGGSAVDVLLRAATSV